MSAAMMVCEGAAKPAKARKQAWVDASDDMSDDPLVARRKALMGARSHQPLARVAALLVSISQNNAYEGRNRHLVPDTLTCGFVSDFVGVSIEDLEASLVALRGLGLVELGPASALRLADVAGLEALADAR